MRCVLLLLLVVACQSVSTSDEARLRAVIDELYTAFDGTWLYVATEGVSGTSGLDHFILVDRDPAGSQSAPWGKSGSVAGWDYLLASEESNGWVGCTTHRALRSPPARGSKALSIWKRSSVRSPIRS